VLPRLGREHVRAPEADSADISEIRGERRDKGPETQHPQIVLVPRRRGALHELRSFHSTASELLPATRRSRKVHFRGKSAQRDVSAAVHQQIAQLSVQFQSAGAAIGGEPEREQVTKQVDHHRESVARDQHHEVRT